MSENQNHNNDKLSEALDKLIADIPQDKLPNIYYEKHINELSIEEFAKFIYTLSCFEDFSYCHIYFINPKPKQYDDKHMFPRDMFHKLYDSSLNSVRIDGDIVIFPKPNALQYLNDWFMYNKPHIQATFFLKSSNIQIKFVQYPRFEMPFEISVFSPNKQQEEAALQYLEKMITEAIKLIPQIFSKAYS